MGDNEYKGALRENIIAFERAIRHDEDIRQLREELRAIKRRLREKGPSGSAQAM